ncbi:hypothetical protein RHGRI_038047 [Rhododendron griersonianum]|uniref:Uncharacterized protein n=1 Tax=Rhododendron griersonianum TaxID=479676 RepID=A0AAV6HV57_9ERIC|nr:hypothetical protein RHGRI_038047 [Rhododendron griersonianum]
MFQNHQLPPAELIQNIGAALQQRAILRHQFVGLLPFVHFEERHAVILVGGDVRAIYRAMLHVGEGGHFWYGVGRSVGTNVASIQRNAQARAFPLAPPGQHVFDWMHAGILNGNIVELGLHPYGGP